MTDAEMHMNAMRDVIAKGDGFIAALDQSGGSTPKALAGYGVGEDQWSSDEEMFGLIHAMRSRIMTSPCFGGGKVIGAILFERTMDGMVDGRPVPAFLAEKGIVPFLKIDKGLENEADGVQRMRPIDGLEELLARARGLGVFGTKERSVIHAASAEGIEAVVAQQFAVAGQVIAAGMMPIIEPEVSIKAADRENCDVMLRDAILRHLDALPDGDEVMLKLTLPKTAGAFDALVDHPRVLRVVALSGGMSRDEACAELARNRGVIASFSRALLNDLRADMDDAGFDRSLGEAIDAIHAASVAGPAPA